MGKGESSTSRKDERLRAVPRGAARVARQVMWQVRPRRHAASAPGVVSLAAELGLGLPCASGAHGAHRGGTGTHIPCCVKRGRILK